MNEYIKQQLDKVSVQLPSYDLSTTHMIIEKSIRASDIIMAVGNFYIIELADYIVNPPDNFDLHINWNNGIIPKYKNMRCHVTQILGKMVKIAGNGIDPDTLQDIPQFWEGWVPRKSIVKIKEI